MVGTAQLPLYALCMLSWGVTVQSAACPWQESGLLKWGDDGTWDSGSVPKDDEEVTIPAGKRVLLNEQPARLATLTIEAGGALIWGDVDGLVLTTHHVLIRGEFHIGSEGCRFEKKAHIRLLGKTDSPYFVAEHEFERKFIGVSTGGTLELHGKSKTSWTKLAQTVNPVKNIDCAFIYDHSDTAKNLIGLERQQGAHVIVWNEGGSVMDFNVFQDASVFAAFFTTIPQGKVVGIFAFGKNGLGRKSEGFVSTIQSLGGSDISQISNGDSYSFLARVGAPDSAREFSKVNGQKEPAPAGYLHLHDPDKGIVFQVSTCASETFKYFRVLNDLVAYPVLTLVDKVQGWEEGDKILVTSTDFDWKQAETRRIIPCGKACSSKRQIRVDDAFQYLHFGNFTYNVDERAEVAILTRNILIEGVMEKECYGNNKDEEKLCKKFYEDTFGGHVRIERGFKSAHVRGVELYHMGQQKRMGAYPLHFHMCDEVASMYLRENSLHHTFSRCITVHGTDFLDVSDNVCYRHYGHGVFIEDAVEQNNTFTGNLVAGTMHGSLLLADMSKEWCKTDAKAFISNCGDLSSFWVSHPNNVLRKNVAAGSDGNGYMYIFADRPLGPSLVRQKERGIEHHPKDFPLDFSGNVAHSNAHSGVFVDGKISTGTGMENKGKVPENGVIQTENEYDPHKRGSAVWTDMSYGTYYKNGNDNLWIKGGNIKISYSAIADSPEGFSGGTTLFNSGTEVYKSIFIGETENKGMGVKRSVAPPKKQSHKVLYYFDQSFPGQPTDSLTAIGLYQGPVIIKNCFFDKYETKSWCLDDESSTECDDDELLTRYAGAISFKRNTNYPSMTSSYVENNLFGYCDNDDGKHWVFHGADNTGGWAWKDGNRMQYFFDKDGKLTGTVNASVVNDIPLYKGPECLERHDWGDLLVCPYRYVKLELLGKGGNLGKDIASNYPLIIRRDDKPYTEPFSIMGEIRNEYLLRTHRSYVIDFNDTHPKAGFPSDYKLFGYGVERQDVVRVGICQPMDVDSFGIMMDYPVVIRDNATWADSLDQLDADTTGNVFFHDKANGILFFKMMSRDTHNNETQRCPRGRCWKLKITVNGGSLKKLRSCANIKVPPFVDNTKKPAKPTIPPCPGIATPEGLGPLDPNNLGFVVHDEFQLPCVETVVTEDREGKQPVGCYKVKHKRDEFQTDLKDLEALELTKSMTVDMCVNRCYHRGYKYAGLSRGRRCTCGNVLVSGADYVGTAKDCKQKCVGNSAEFCGSKKYLNVWTTGK
ncbi:cell surface hyaluronidase CEMIP2-like isoform X2 [Littorina saxatilis]|uniref:G8 domain-containing protein n=2 Tax=Littorina saxatilis TaxID=31220 RepID=A0AAN9B332_9CAEN